MEEQQRIYNELLAQGFSPEEIERAMIQQQQGAMMSNANSNFMAQPEENLVKWELEIDSILERAEHTLRGDKLKMINDGKSIKTQWITLDENHKERILNDAGVNECMKLLSLYVNRNKLLSYYEEKEIHDKVYDFGIGFSNLLYMNSNKFGLNSLDKRKHYYMLVLTMCDIVEDAYRRALRGKTRDIIHSTIQIRQDASMGGMDYPYQMQPINRGGNFFTKLIKGR